MDSEEDTDREVEEKVNRMSLINTKIKDTVNNSIKTIRSIDRGSLKSLKNSTAVPVTVRQDTLFQFLVSLKLESCYGVLVEAGFDDLDMLIAQQQSSNPADENFLANIGISKPGYRALLLAKLSDLLYLTKHSVRDSFISFTERDPCFPCCTSKPRRRVDSLPKFRNLKEWLNLLHLEHLHSNFLASGYDDLENILYLMHT